MMCETAIASLSSADLEYVGECLQRLGHAEESAKSLVTLTAARQAWRYMVTRWRNIEDLANLLQQQRHLTDSQIHPVLKAF
jgi:hypothetical protein